MSPEKLALEMEQAEKENIDSQEETYALNTEDVSIESQLGDHSFKRVSFNPFSPTMCKYCRKYLFGIRKAYMCQGTLIFSLIVTFVITSDWSIRLQLSCTWEV